MHLIRESPRRVAASLRVAAAAAVASVWLVAGLVGCADVMLGGSDVDSAEVSPNSEAVVLEHFQPEDAFLPPPDVPPRVWLLGADGERVSEGQLVIARWDVVDSDSSVDDPVSIEWPATIHQDSRHVFEIEVGIRP